MVRIIKPKTLGIITRTQPQPVGTLFIVSVYGLFDVQAPGTFLMDQAMWPALAKELPDGVVFDTGMLKPQGEMLIAGRAVAPGGTPVKAMMIEARLGTLVKRAAVFGDRYWMGRGGGFAFSDPVPFTEMPIDPRRMFGGPDHPVNTVGVGHRALQTFDAAHPSPLPNFEDPLRLIRSIDDAPPSAGLGPIDPMSREKQKYAGTYDKLWQEKLAPALPLDADPRLFCAAPQDQRIPGFFAGDEPLHVVGMTPAGYSGVLPGLRARAFVERTSDPAGFCELDMRLDTVLLLGSLGKGVVVFRGALPVADIDAKDIATTLLAYERMNEVPRPIEHYAEVLRLRTDPQTAKKYVFAESQLTPDLSEADKQRRRKAREDYMRAFEERFAEGMHLVTRRQFAEAGLPEALVPAKPAPVPLPVLLPSPEELESGDVDLAELIDGIERERLKFDEKAAALQAATKQATHADGSVDIGQLLDSLEAVVGPDAAAVKQGLADARAEAPSLEKMQAELPDVSAQEKALMAQTVDAGTVLRPPVSLVGDDDAFEEARARFLELPTSGIMGKIREAVDGLENSVRSQNIPTAGEESSESHGALLAALEKPAAGGEEVTAKVGGVNAQLAKSFPALANSSASPMEALLDSLAGPAASADLDSQVGELRGKLDESEQMLRDGVAQLRRLAVEPTFPETPLTKPAALRFGMFVYERYRGGLDCRGKDMAGADLSGMDLSGIDLRGAFLERANLTGANLAGALCQDAVFAGAILDRAVFDGAVLTNANLARVSARATSFRQANLDGFRAIEACFAGADFDEAFLAKSQLIQVDFSDAHLNSARLKEIVFLKSSLRNVEADRSVLERCQLIDCSAAHLRLRGASLTVSQILKLDAPNADFSGAVLQRVGFASGAKLSGAHFDGSSIAGVTFQGADLAAASFVRARADGAVFSEANLTDANFSCASLKRAQFGSADLTRADLFAANLFQALMRRAVLVGARLRAANLYSANLSDSDLTGTDLTYANFGKSRLALETSHAA